MKMKWKCSEKKWNDTQAKTHKTLRELLTYNKEGLLEESSAPTQSR